MIQSEWQEFVNNSNTKLPEDSLHIKLSKKITEPGIYDFTSFLEHKELAIALVNVKDNAPVIKMVDYEKVMDVLLERTGMGNTGESYLVGEDFRMRTQSRFLEDVSPTEIMVRTEGVRNALNSKSGKGIYKDYRNIDVYGVYGLIELSNLKLTILSEIDKDEVEAPLKSLKRRLLILLLLIMLIAIFLSLFLTKIIADPIIKMKKSLKVMAQGNYDGTDTYSKNSDEIKEMYEALNLLKKSLQGAVDFSKKIGEMNLNTNYSPKSKNDALGNSLIKMRDKLIEFRNSETTQSMRTKRQLLDGLENERRRLSRELHDGIGPLLTSLRIYIENKVEDKALQREMKKLADETISEVRLMSNALMPSTIDDFGVGVALSNFFDQMRKSTETSIAFEDLLKPEQSRITKDQEINLFRICQELTNNSLKHAMAKNIRVTLSEFDDFISLFYFDDGIGFDLDRVNLGSGIINIKERVELCNGTIEISSKPGNTTFIIELPIEDGKN
ncbi:sensor histidine kinase [Aestuariivivens sediminicola]|uniref:sensor histidine kinase n=1 Tax=Aestuariivivens sediminicola TaxID=2913560 RepID=UPI001F564797|nr:sensor histidine kinase [Aestuariivivens sediminicola]